MFIDLRSTNGVYLKWNENLYQFSEFRKSDKSLKDKLESI